MKYQDSLLLHQKLVTKITKLEDELEIERREKLVFNNEMLKELKLSLRPEDIDILNGIPIEQKYDATFIRMALKCIYAHEPSKIMNKNAFKSKPSTQNDLTQSEMTPLTPHKVDLIRKMYKCRLRKINLSESEFLVRANEKKFRKTVCSSLINLKRKNTQTK